MTSRAKGRRASSIGSSQQKERPPSLQSARAALKQDKIQVKDSSKLELVCDLAPIKRGTRTAFSPDNRISNTFLGFYKKPKSGARQLRASKYS